MAEVGAAASIVGIASAALQSVQSLCTTIDKVKSAPDTIRKIKDDLQSVESVLHHLDTACRSDDTQIVLRSEVKFGLENCGRACKVLIGHWMRHSSEDKTFWVDRLRVGIFGQERIKTFKDQLNGCKSTLSVALSTATIITITRQQGIMQEMKDRMLYQNGTVLQAEIARAESDRGRIRSALQTLIDDGIQHDQETEQSRQDLLQEIQQQQASNERFREMCEELLSRTVYERTGQKIKGVKATEDSIAVAGFINTSGENLKIRQDISDVNADKRSYAGAGVIKNLGFKDLRLSSAAGQTGYRA